MSGQSAHLASIRATPNDLRKYFLPNSLPSHILIIIDYLIDVVSLTRSATTAIKLVTSRVSVVLAAGLALDRMTEGAVTQDLTRRAIAAEITETIADSAAQGATAEKGVMTVIVIEEVAFAVMIAMTSAKTDVMTSGAIAVGGTRDAP